MSRKPSFANLRGTTPAPKPTPAPSPAPSPTARARTSTVPASAPVMAPEPAAPPAPAARPVSREGRKQIAGFFTPDMSLAMHMLARRQGRSLQALMAEAFNDVLRKHGESPIGD